MKFIAKRRRKSLWNGEKAHLDLERRVTDLERRVTDLEQVNNDVIDKMLRISDTENEKTAKAILFEWINGKHAEDNDGR